MPGYRNQDQSFRKLLNILLDEQRVGWDRVQSKKRRRQRQKILNKLSRYLIENEPDISQGPIDLARERKALIPLPPLEKDAHLFPFLTLFYEGTGDEDTCCRLYVLLLRWAGGDIDGIGFRIDSPEKNCGVHDGGRHNFYHVQFVRNIRGWTPIYKTPDWLPVSQPSIPLWATTPLDALLDLILTLYGGEYYLSFWKTHGTQLARPSDEFVRLIELLRTE